MSFVQSSINKQMSMIPFLDLKMINDQYKTDLNPGFFDQTRLL